MATADDDVQTHLDNGARFVAVGIDVSLFGAALRAKAARWCKG
jgi:2-keto-3-deoxy-L-rhamnonate aldolase RhmA